MKKRPEERFFILMRGGVDVRLDKVQRLPRQSINLIFIRWLSLD